MKAVILAAGRGVRMGNRTKDLPKTMLPVSGKPFLHYLFKNLMAAGLNEFVPVVGYKREKIIDFLKKEKINAEVVVQEEQLGTGHAVNLVQDIVGDNDFLLVSGDNLFGPHDIKRFLKKDSFTYVGAIKVKDPQKYGVLVEEEGFLKKIVEKPETFVGNLVNASIYRLTPEIFEMITRTKKSKRGEYEITDAINLLCERRTVKIIELGEHWLDLGCPSDIKKISAFLRGDKN